MHFPITIGVRRSCWLSFAIVFSHVSAALLLFIPDWPLLVPIACALLLLVSGAYALRQSSPKTDALRLLVDGRLECRFEGVFCAVDLASRATVHPVLTVLRLIYEGQAIGIVLLPDSASAEERRHLRVWLRWRAGFGGKDKANLDFR